MERGFLILAKRSKTAGTESLNVKRPAETREIKVTFFRVDIF